MSRIPERVKYEVLEEELGETESSYFDLRVNQILINAANDDSAISIPHVAKYLLGTEKEVEDAIGRIQQSQKPEIIYQSAEGLVGEVIAKHMDQQNEEPLDEGEIAGLAYASRSWVGKVKRKMREEEVPVPYTTFDLIRLKKKEVVSLLADHERDHPSEPINLLKIALQTGRTTSYISKIKSELFPQIPSVTVAENVRVRDLVVAYRSEGKSNGEIAHLTGRTEDQIRAIAAKLIKKGLLIPRVHQLPQEEVVEREQIIRVKLESGLSQAQVARDLKINDTIVSRIRRRLQNRGELHLGE